jgi:hypothetical protein
MLGYFTDPYPDELLYSACARFSDRSNYRNLATTARQLFGGSGSAAVAFPNRLAHLISLLPAKSYTIDRLIDDHTLLRFYSPFVHEDRVKLVRLEMAGDKDNRIYSRLAINTGGVPMPQALRFCPQCVIVDRREFGETYWHRVHQLAGIEVCPSHSTLLDSSRADWRGRNDSWTFRSAESSIDLKDPRLIDPANPQHLLLLRIAEQARWLLEWRGMPPGKSELQTRYYNRLLKRGLAYYDNGRIHNKDLAREFVKFYSHDFLTSLNSDVRSNLRGWMFDLLRRGCINESQPPIRHLLLMIFLGCSAEDLLTTFQEYKPFGEGPWPCLNRTATHYRQAVVEQCRITNGQKHNKGHPLGMFSCSCGFRYLRVGPDRDENDRYRFNRVDSYGQVWEAHFKKQWNDDSVTLTNLAAELGVIPFTLRRHAIRLKLPFPRGGRWARPTTEEVFIEYGKPRRTFAEELRSRRQEWLSLRRRHPRAGRNQLIALACYTYYWLSRHDPNWLFENSPIKKPSKPSPNRVNWKEWDQKLPKQIEKVSADLMNQSGRPVRVSKEEIIRRLEHRSWFEQRLDKLPKTAKALNRFVESREDFFIRRVRWTELLFVQERKRPSYCQFIRTAGLQTLSGKGARLQAAVNSACRNLQAHRL